MNIKTHNLTGPALDWAVAKCEGMLEYIHDTNSGELWFYDREKGSDAHFWPSTNWAQGGPIIEREVITLIHPRWDGWTAHKYDDRIEDESYTVDGPTPLIAAMRCYVASVLGDTVEIPEELK
jgi:hypothetical protein